jgi:hypothetical protein
MRVSRPVFMNTLRWFLDSPARLVAAGLMMLFVWLVVGGAAHIIVNGTPQTGVFDTPASALARYGNVILTLVGWILGLGVIRREISSGAIQLVLLRPLTRADYVLSKWAALAALNLAFLAFLDAVLLLKGGGSLLNAGLLAVILAQAGQVLALAAVITFLSAVPSGLGELGLLLLAGVALLVLGHYAQDQPWLTRLVDGGFKVLRPQVVVEGNSAFFGMIPLESASVDSVSSLLFNACVAAAALAGAVGLMARREFTYAESGG